MKSKNSLLYLVIFIFCTNAFSQAKIDSTNSNIFHKHSLQFRVSSFLNLSSFKGSLLSYKYHFNDNQAFRLGIDLGSKIDEYDENNDYFRYDTSNSGKTISQTYYDIFVVGEYLYYVNPTKEIKLFIGFGPQLKVFKSIQKTDKIFNSDTSASYSYYKNSYRQIAEYGISTVYGIEWFFRSNMSLHAEYSFIIVYSINSRNSHRVAVSRNYDHDHITKTGYDDKGFIFRSNIVRFGLSVYL